MKGYSFFLPIALLMGLMRMTSAPQQKPTLDDLLHKMDEVAATFRSAEAQIESKNYEAVIQDFDEPETGEIYYRRNDKGLEMMLDITKPDKKQVLLDEGTIRLYQPKIDRVTLWNLGKNKAEFESYLVLGFGGSGQDLEKEFDVTNAGTEKIDGIATVKLQLAPKSQKVKNTFNQIVLWMDPNRGVAVQQQFFQPGGNYRLAKYTNIQVNGKKIPDDVFKLKTNGKTQVVSPGG
ncbi:MAG TPA: outer membrane lipoprotein carrier protein LolA [Verrucomicrobiae bacterium]|jgi:outer membrane lipoprotein-sorting protein|nr:outer membrane lipoprotein carrier protein LolA [Verrucomicrobiae bacterium]